MSSQKITLHEHRCHHLTRGMHFEAGILSHYQAFNSAVEKNPHPSHTWDSASLSSSLLELAYSSLRLPPVCYDSTYVVSCYPRCNTPRLTMIKIKVQLPRAESPWAATQQSASKPASEPPSPPRGWQEDTANAWQAAAVPGPRTWKECSPSLSPFPCSRQLTAAGSSRSASASSGDRRRPAGEGGACNPAGRAWLCNESTAWASARRLLTAPHSSGQEFLSKSCHSRQRVGRRPGSGEQRTENLRLSDHLLLVLTGEQNELVLWKPSNIKATTSFKLLVNLSLGQPWPASNMNNQGRGMTAGNIFPRKILENGRYWDISEFGSTTEALLI